MNKWLLSLIALTIGSHFYAQVTEINHLKIEEDFEQMINNLRNNYAYLEDKKVDLDCIYEQYKAKIPSISTEEERLLFFEILLDEFYDSHMILMKAIWPSYRLDSPIYCQTKDGHTTITNIWQTQLETSLPNVLGAKVLEINGVPISTKINQFPTVCQDKQEPEIRNWLANKVISGKYNEPRILTLQLPNGDLTKLDLDSLQLKEHKEFLSVSKKDNIGIIRFNNSLGENRVIEQFDAAVDSLMSTKGLILDLRNTTGGGNSYVARGIMSRFITKSLPYQKHHLLDERWDEQPAISRSWVEYVSPRGITYKQPVVVLVGRWTGSMGEGLAIGMDGLGRADIVGSEMKRLAGGSTNDFHLNNENLNYKIMTEKLFHLNGTPRHEYVPEHYVKQSSITTDDTLEKAMQLIR